MKPYERIDALLSQLRLERAFIGASILSELQPLIERAPSRFPAVTLVNPNRLETNSLSALGSGITIVTGDSGLPASVVDSAMPSLPDGNVIRLPGYHTAAWSDMVAEAPEVILEALRQPLNGDALPPADLPFSEGEVAEISYTVAGHGPPLLLLPLLLAPSQWDSIVQQLERDFTVIRLGGEHLGMIAMLESRGSEPGYVRAIRSVFDEVAAAPGECVLEIGCGSGVLARWIAAHLGGRNPVVATDLNPFFLREASALASRAEVDGLIRFEEANAEALPFPDDSIDIAFSSTVMEECDAEKMLAEMVRVTRPGGRVAVVVRATDAHSVCGVDVGEDIRTIIQAPYRSVGEHGVADASLYRRFSATGLEQCRFFPHLLTLTDPEGAAWAYREPFFVGQFSEEQSERWARAKTRAKNDGTFVFASGLHCAVGTKPE